MFKQRGKTLASFSQINISAWARAICVMLEVWHRNRDVGQTGMEGRADFKGGRLKKETKDFNIQVRVMWPEQLRGSTTRPNVFQRKLINDISLQGLRETCVRQEWNLYWTCWYLLDNVVDWNWDLVRLWAEWVILGSEDQVFNLLPSLHNHLKLVYQGQWQSFRLT